jgi:hypothetical protein
MAARRGIVDGTPTARRRPVEREWNVLRDGSFACGRAANVPDDLRQRWVVTGRCHRMSAT